jgi:hypothetical protein
MAARCVALAQRASDVKDRAFLLEMAQRWFHLAEFGWDPDQMRAIRVEIGQRLRVEFALPRELTGELAALIARIEERHAE